MRTQPIVPAELGTRPAGHDEGSVSGVSELPYSPAFGDVYHAAAGALPQARHVFLGGNGLPQRWSGRPRFVILETGFGLGNNFLAAWDAWRTDPQRCERLVFVSIEKHPPRLADLARVHEASPLPELARQLVAAWPPLAPGLHTLTFEAARVQLLLGLGDVADLLPALVAQVDAFFLDGFAPAKNPQMWEAAVLQRLGRLAAPGATAATWSAARGVRDGLQAAGFEVSLAPGFAGKREMTTARFAPRHQPEPPAGGLRTATCERQALIIGAGLAGAAAAWGLAEQGWHSTVLDAAATPAGGASGNPGGLFHAIVHGEDGIHARAHRAAALATAALAGRWIAEGEVCGQLAGMLRLDARLPDDEATALQARLGLPADVLHWLPQAMAASRVGTDLPSGGWIFGQGGWLRPADYVRAMLAASGASFVGEASVARLVRRDGLWEAQDATGLCLARAPVAIVAAGPASAALLAPLTDAPMPLAAVRGQITQLPASVPSLHPPHVPVAGAGYALQLEDGSLLCGATTQHHDDEPAPRPADDTHNLEQAIRLGALDASALPAAQALAQGRVGWRAVTPDRLPLVGAVPLPATQLAGRRLDQSRLVPRLRDADGGLYVLSGLGSRGITWSALAGRLLASWVSGSPCPVEADLRDALDPARFVARAAREG